MPATDNCGPRGYKTCRKCMLCLHLFTSTRRIQHSSRLRVHKWVSLLFITVVCGVRFPAPHPPFLVACSPAHRLHCRFPLYKGSVILRVVAIARWLLGLASPGSREDVWCKARFCARHSSDRRPSPLSASYSYDCPKMESRSCDLRSNRVECVSKGWELRPAHISQTVLQLLLFFFCRVLLRLPEVKARCSVTRYNRVDVWRKARSCAHHIPCHSSIVQSYPPLCIRHHPIVASPVPPNTAKTSPYPVTPLLVTTT